MKTSVRLPAVRLLAALLLYLAAAGAFAGPPAFFIPEVLYPAEAPRGGALSGCALACEPIAGLQVVLENPAGQAVSAARGFSLEDSGGLWAFLLALPSTLPGGQYTLRLEAQAPEGGLRFSFVGSVQVSPTEFLSEQIHFDKALSQLMTEPDPQKQEEQRRLRFELEAFRPEAVFHLGAFRQPLGGARLTSGFADRRRYLYADGGSSLSLHNGLDLAAPVGTPVLSCGAGRVVMAEDRLLTGKSVLLEHLPGVYSLYYHLSELAVRAGQEVQAGERIGAVGMTGLATGPHLHWELRVNGQPVDPRGFLEQPLVDKSRYLSIIEGLSQNEGR
jgi:murein DD-endopeptidase MepM/ murein hydrolase activator NlpD